MNKNSQEAEDRYSLTTTRTVGIFKTDAYCQIKNALLSSWKHCSCICLYAVDCYIHVFLDL